jgi:hypothetical protein
VTGTHIDRETNFNAAEECIRWGTPIRLGRFALGIPGSAVVKPQIAVLSHRKPVHAQDR